MSASKNYYWDEAEKALDNLKAKKDAGESIDSIIKFAKEQEVAWDLVGFDTDVSGELESQLKDWLQEA